MKNTVTLIVQLQLQGTPEIILWILEELSVQNLCFFSSTDFINGHNSTSAEKGNHALLNKKEQVSLLGYQGIGRALWQFFQRQA